MAIRTSGCGHGITLTEFAEALDTLKALYADHVPYAMVRDFFN